MVLSIVLLLFFSLSITCMQSDPAYYFVHTDRFGFYRATFYDNDLLKFPEKYVNDKFIKRQSLSKAFWDISKQNECDSLIKGKLPELTHAQIFTDTSDQYIEYHFKDPLDDSDDTSGRMLSYHTYNGPIDIKKDSLRIDLIKPHKLLSTIKRVDEYSTYPIVGIPYRKRYITYNNDGISKITTTWQHRLIQGTYLAIGLGVTALCLKKFSHLSLTP